MSPESQPAHAAPAHATSARADGAAAAGDRNSSPRPAPASVYPRSTPETARRRRELAPEIAAAWDTFSSTVFAEGALDKVTKQLIAVAVAHVTQCPYCIEGHTKLAHRTGATDEQIMEAIWVAAEMRAGGAYAHSAIALTALAEHTPAAGHAHPVAGQSHTAAAQ